MGMMSTMSKPYDFETGLPPWHEMLLSAGVLAGAGWGTWRMYRRARREHHRIPPGSRIVVLGGGFGGVNVVRTLLGCLPRNQDCDITIVDRGNYIMFTPMLAEVAGGSVESRHIITSLRNLEAVKPEGGGPRVRFVQGDVQGVDMNNKRVTVKVGDSQHRLSPVQRDLEYDQLVLALGSVTNYHHLDGVEENALSIKSLHDAMLIPNRIIAILERADAEPSPDMRQKLLSFVVVGGGYSGVEAMAAINDLVRESLPRYHNLAELRPTIRLIHGDARLLPELSADLAAYAQKKLEERGVEIMLGRKIKAAGEGWIELDDGSRLDARLLVWAGGVRPSPVIGVLDVERGHHGGAVVDRTCAVKGRAGVWAIGDCAEVPQGKDGKSYAPTAQNATREAALVALNIIADLRGEKKREFHYKPVGSLALVGKHYGVGSLFGVHFSGTLAWFLWRAVYWAKMPSWNKRVRVGLDWALDAVFGRDLAELSAAH
jgi:NADH dehydrogenase